LDELLISYLFPQYHKMPDWYSDILGYVNIILTAMFSVECVLKVIAFGYAVSRIPMKDSLGWMVISFISKLFFSPSIISRTLGTFLISSLSAGVLGILWLRLPG